eukprot:jgi/Ulvmu1/7241/UM035_0028.1
MQCVSICSRSQAAAFQGRSVTCHSVGAGWPDCVHGSKCSSHMLRSHGFESVELCNLADALQRYYYYLEAGVHDEHIMKLPAEWLQNVFSLVPRDKYPSLPDDIHIALVQQEIAELQKDFSNSMRKAIIDYLLKSPVERKRLRLEPLESVLMYPDVGTKRRVDVALRVLPRAWVSHVEQARNNIAWSLQTLSANALELSALWHLQGFSETLLVDVASASFMSRLPMEAVDFEAHQHECHERVKSALWTHWLPKCAEIFRLIPPVCINADAAAYYRSIATLQGNQLRQLVNHTLQHYVEFFEQYQGVDQIDPQQDTLLWSKPAVFNLQIRLDESNHPVFSPTIEKISCMVLEVLDGAVRTTFDMPRIGSQIMVVASSSTSQGKSASNSIPTMDLEDDRLAEAQSRVAGVIEANKIAPQRVVELFETYLTILDQGQDAFVSEVMGRIPEPSLDDFECILSDLDMTADAVRCKSANNVCTGLFSVDVSVLKAELIDALDGLKEAVLIGLRERVMQSSDLLIEMYQRAEAEVSKVSSTGEEVLALKKTIQKEQLLQERMRDTIQQNKDTIAFLVSHRLPISQEDLDVTFKCYEWPAKISKIMKDAITKATTDHKQFEQQLKSHRKSFGDSLGSLEGRVLAFEMYDVIARRAEHAREVLDLMSDLKAAQEAAEQINIQERMFGWGCTKYGNIAKLIQSLEPYHVLWMTVFEFYDKSSVWLNSPFKDIDAEEVEDIVNDMFRKIFKLSKQFSGVAAGMSEQEAPHRVASDVWPWPKAPL